MKKTIISIIQIILSILFIFFTFGKIELNSLGKILKNSNLFLFILSPITYLISQLFSSERLRKLLMINGFKLSFIENGKLYLIGMFYNFYMPGGIGGDLYKTYLLKKIYSWEVKDTIKIVIQDRLIGLGVLFILLLFLENGLVTDLNQAVSGGTAEGVSFGFNTDQFDEGINTQVGNNHIIKIIISISGYFVGFYLVKFIFKDNKGFFKTFILSFVVQFFQFLSIILIIYSLGITANISHILFFYVISSILSIFSFGGIGIREFVFFSAASILTVSEELSLSIGLLFTISAAISSLPGLYFIIKKTKG